MIAPGTILELLDKEPFEPFRIRMADGHDYEVANPDLAVAMENTLFLAAPNRDRFKLLSYINITSIESPSKAA